MDLFSGGRQAERPRGLEGAGEGEVIGLDRLAEHVSEVEYGGGEMTVLDRTGDEGGPGDDGARGVELEDELS